MPPTKVEVPEPEARILSTLIVEEPRMAPETDKVLATVEEAWEIKPLANCNIPVSRNLPASVNTPAFKVEKAKKPVPAP